MPCRDMCVRLSLISRHEAFRPVADLSRVVSQVLISIQSMIFVSDPYYNEPGYEASRNTAAGRESSQRYDEEQQLNTMLYAILPALSQPCPAFAAAIRYDSFPAVAGA